MCEIRCDGLRVAYLVFGLLYVDNVLGFVNDELVNELYTMYRDAVNSEPSSSQRRLFKNNKEYNLHVERLKEVNGFKKHNLIIKEVLRSDTDPIIYINNPVESKIPNAYLTLEEFKKILSERVKKEQDSFKISTKYKKISNTFYNTITTSNPINTKERVYKTISNKKDTTKIKNKPPTEELKPKSLKFNTSGFPTNVVPTRTSTTKTTTNNIDKSVDKNVTETQSEDTSIHQQINTTPGIIIIVNNTIMEVDNNVTQNTIREDTTHLEEKNDEKSTDSTLALKLITDEEPSRSEEKTTEEIQPDISTVTSTETTTFSTTTTRSRKLDRPRVFVGR